MTNPVKALAIACASFLFGWFLVFAAFAAERQCYPLASLKVSFRVVFPKAVQSTIEGADARQYLSAYNAYGQRTGFRGETILLNVMPDGTTLLVPIEDGQGCKRLLVGPKLHRHIMSKVARGRS